jgi:hypothetical protein
LADTAYQDDRDDYEDPHPSISDTSISYTPISYTPISDTDLETEISKVHTSPTFAWVAKTNDQNRYRVCLHDFSSGNTLHKHLDETKHYLQTKAKPNTPWNPAIVKNDTFDMKVGTGYAFRDYNYCEIKILLDPKQKQPGTACLDTGSGMSMIHAKELEGHPWLERISLKKPVRIKGVGDALHDSWETVLLMIYIPDESGAQLAQIEGEFHIVSDLDCRLLIGTDVITPEKMLINLHKRKLVIGSCRNIIYVVCSQSYAA